MSSTNIVVAKLSMSHSAVTLRGIDGSTEPQLFESYSPSFITNRSFEYAPSKIVGQDASDQSISDVAIELLKSIRGDLSGAFSSRLIMFFAYDFGGLIVKQVEYTSLFSVLNSFAETEQVISIGHSVFYGMPHRASDSQTWDVNALRILNLCFKGVLGPWVPSYLVRLSKYQDTLNNQFIKLASQISVVNICQDADPSRLYDLITDPSCATIGLATEEKILLQRSHYQLAFILDFSHRTSMEDILLNAVIRHWEFYHSFIAIMRLNAQDTREHIIEREVDDKKELCRLVSDPIIQGLQDAPSVLRVILGENLTFATFSELFARHIEKTIDGVDGIVLKLGSDWFNSRTLEHYQLYSSLCIQLLLKRPALILWIRHLYANVRDSILGPSKLWKSRVMARCLRVLLLAPKKGPLYCLIQHGLVPYLENVISQILEVVHQSEMKVHILVSEIPLEAEAGSEAWSQWSCVDLSHVSSDLQDPDTTQEARQMSLIFSSDTTNSRNSLDGSSSFDFILSRCDNWGMNWVLQAVAWIYFTIHPLSITETQHALEIIYYGKRSNPLKDVNGRSLLQALELVLGRVVDISKGLVRISRQKYPDLKRIWTAYFPHTPHPEVYVAEACLSHAVAVLTTNPDPVMSTRSEFGAEEPISHTGSTASANINHTAQGQQNFRLSTCGNMTNYAMKYWFEHYCRAATELTNAADLFCLVMSKHAQFDRDNWIRHLIACYWSTDIDLSFQKEVLPSVMETKHGLSPFFASDISFRMASLPLVAEDDFTWLLLAIAYDRLPEELYFGFVLAIIGGLGETTSIDTLHRVVAASPEHLANRFISHFENLGLLRDNYTQFVMSSIAVGNSKLAIKLLAMKPKFRTLHKHEDDTELNLGTALQVACEYGDSNVVDHIIKSGIELSDEYSYTWSALHIACYHGNKALVEKLVDQERRGKLPEGGLSLKICPLLITSSHGLFGISGSLVGVVKPASFSEAVVSPVQLASQFGFSKTLYSLLNDHHCKVALDSSKNNALCLSLRSGNNDVAHQIFGALQSLSREVQTETKALTGSGFDGDDSDDSASSVADGPDDIEYHPILEEVLGRAVLTATECGTTGDLYWTLLRNVNLEKITDSKGRAPLTIAARSGRWTNFLILFYHGAECGPVDKKKRNAMHNACYHGHHDMVHFLMRRQSPNLSIRDYEAASPITSAAEGGYYHTFLYLLPYLSDEDLKIEIRLASENGRDVALAKILNFVTSSDPSTRSQYVNSRSETKNTALHLAARGNHVRAVQYLLQQGADIAAMNIFGVTPLGIATISSSLETMKLLLDAGASTESMDTRRRPLLAHAIYFEEADSVELLLQYGASTNMGDHWLLYDSILDLTVMGSTPAILKILLRHFDNMLKLTENGRPHEGILQPTEAVRYVINAGSIPMLEALLDIWQDFDTVISDKNYSYCSVLQYAAKISTSRVLRCVWDNTDSEADLNKVAGTFGTVVQAAITSARDTQEKLNMLFEWGAHAVPSLGSNAESQWASSSTDPNHPSSTTGDTGPLHGSWGTALHAAAFFTGDIDVIKLLLRHKGVSKDQSDMMGRLPLHLSACSKRASWAVFNELSSEISTIFSTDFQGRNGLHAACSAGNLELVQQMLETDGRILINSTDLDGWTPLHWACRSGNRTLVELLMKHGANHKLETRDQGWLPYHVAIHSDLEAPDILEFQIRDSPGQVHREGLLGWHANNQSGVKGRLFEVVHGYKGSKNKPRTLIVFDWLFIPGSLGDRIKNVNIVVAFQATGTRDGVRPGGSLEEWDPVPIQWAPNDPILSRHAKPLVTEVVNREVAAAVGYEPFVTLEPKINKEVTTAVERIDYRYITGSPAFVSKNSGNWNAINWELRENFSLRSGVQYHVRTAVMLRRQPYDFGKFNVTVQAEANASYPKYIARLIIRALRFPPADGRTAFDPTIESNTVKEEERNNDIAGRETARDWRNMDNLDLMGELITDYEPSATV
ncbi:hypothetical protein NPX13_g6607 [Xylaria arbuscula]|uniref:Protein SSH4 n=1 Tax=Xylaria arbuscula TaxID=114810 RepID=A0A9W8NC59_9PEZI|nr:hypothetical protein NPX13_g6607 [Xylaria arbuscula]